MYAVYVLIIASLYQPKNACYLPKRSIHFNESVEFKNALITQGKTAKSCLDLTKYM